MCAHLQRLGFRWPQYLIHNSFPSWIRHIYNILKIEKRFESKLAYHFITSPHTKCYIYLSVSVKKPSRKCRSHLVANCYVMLKEVLYFSTIYRYKKVNIIQYGFHFRSSRELCATIVASKIIVSLARRA